MTSDNNSWGPNADRLLRDVPFWIYRVRQYRHRRSILLGATTTLAVMLLVLTAYSLVSERPALMAHEAKGQETELIGLATNGLATNGLATNGLVTNGLVSNGLVTNGLSMAGPLTNGLGANGLNEAGLSSREFSQWFNSNPPDYSEMVM